MDNAERVRKRRRLLRQNPLNYKLRAMGYRGESDNERQEGTGTTARGYGQSSKQNTSAKVDKPIPIKQEPISNVVPIKKEEVKKQTGVDDTELINRLNKEKAEESKQKMEPVRQQGNKKQRLRNRFKRTPQTTEEKARTEAKNKKVLDTVKTVAGVAIGATVVGRLGKVAQIFAKTPAGKALMKKGKAAFKKGLARFTKAYKKRFPQADLAKKKQPRDARGRTKTNTNKDTKEKTTPKKTTTKKTNTKESKTERQKILDELAKERGKRKVIGKALRKSQLRRKKERDESKTVKGRLDKAVSMYKKGELVVRKKVGKAVETVGKKIQPKKIKTGARTGPPKKSNNRLRREERKRKLDKFVDSRKPKTEKDRTYDKAVKGQVDSKQLRNAITEKFRSMIGAKGKINLSNADRRKANQLRENVIKQTSNKIISEAVSKGLVTSYGKALAKILKKYE